MNMLKARLYDFEIKKKRNKVKIQIKSEIGWGHQIRSYVLSLIN